MRLKNDEYMLLKRIHWDLLSYGKEELAAELQNLLTRFEVTRERTRAHNRANAHSNREAGYTWNSIKRTKTSKYYSTKELS